MTTFADNNTYDEAHLRANYFDDDAILAARAARDEALREGQSEIGVRHLLIGLLSDHQNAASQIVATLGASPTQLAQAAQAMAAAKPASTSATPTGNTQVVTWAPEMQKIYELAVDEALHAYPPDRSVGVAYLLLGMLRFDPADLEPLLKQHGVMVESVRRLLRAQRNQP